jgi:hypothetical protein
MLIEADARGERKIGTNAHEHPAPPPVIDVEVVLNDPPICDLKMPSVRFAVADRSHDTGRLTRFEDYHDFIGIRPFEVRIDEVIAAAFRGFHNRDVPFPRPSFQPSLELVGNAAQRVPANRIELPVRVEEANHALRLLERLYQPIQKDPIKATVMPTDAALVVFVEGVHERPRPTQPQQGTAAHGRRSSHPQAQGISRAEPLAS